MSQIARYLLLSAATLALALVVAFIGATAVLGESPRNVGLLIEYVAVSGALALCVGLLGMAVGMRYLPRLSLKVATAYAFGSLGAIATIAYTPVLMFESAKDLHLLVLLLLCFMVISLGLGSLIALRLADHLEVFRKAARSVAEGKFDTRVDVQTRDELSELATAFNRMSSELGDAFARQQTDEQGRRDLIAAISHDLRTPLASINAMLAAIEDGVVQDSPTVTQYHVAIREEVKRLSRLIDDLFELSRLESGATELRIASVDLNELVHETVESLKPTANLRGVLLSAQSQYQSCPASIDPDGMQRVLINLIQNAIRHTPKGGSVKVALRPHASEWAIEVRDSGEGINPSDAPHIFDRFYRGEKSRTRTDDASAGLGLAIAKAIVEAHRGRIWLEEAPSAGATFVFSVPVAGADRQLPISAQA